MIKKSLRAYITNSEIINFKMVESFDLSFSGTICVKLVDGTSTYVSRRYLSKIKQWLGIWGACMKKKTWGRILLGFPLGMHWVIWYFSYRILFAMCSSIGRKYGQPALCCNLTNYLVWIAWFRLSAISIIWQLDHSTISRQTGIYFLLASRIILPIAYFANWMEHTLMGLSAISALSVLFFF